MRLLPYEVKRWISSTALGTLFKPSALSLFKQSQRLFSSLSAFESVPPRPQLRRLRKAAAAGRWRAGGAPGRERGVGAGGWAAGEQRRPGRWKRPFEFPILTLGRLLFFLVIQGVIPLA